MFNIINNNGKNSNFANGVCMTMGTFDGVHLGHQYLLNKLINVSKKQKLPSLVLTYSNHPKEILNKEIYPYLLTEISKKTEILMNMGIDHIVYLDFDFNLANLSPMDFLKNILVEKFNVKYIVLGYDCHFGKNRKGNYSFLKENERKYGYNSLLIEPFTLSGNIISSSMIRDLVKSGDLANVSKMMGRLYSVQGKVIRGSNIGKSLGFPTINIAPDENNKLLPTNGIYISKVLLKQKYYNGISNIGISPTLKNLLTPQIETHIFDFKESIYGSKVEIKLVELLRSELKFSEKTELIRQIRQDIKKAKLFFMGNEC